MATDTEVIKSVNKIQGHSTSNPTSIAQIAALTAIERGLDFVYKMRDEFKKRRDYMVDKLNSINGITCIKPEGAFYTFPDISKTGMDSFKFCERLLDQSHVAAIPGIAFGHDENIRLSYACSMESIEKGLDRLEKFVNNI